ncbi:MAG: alpha/beta fold hydrolase [Mobilicoccus sp.]|nr:alpha/beta fold hydrolase [Mobilicoccus sp.]
MSRILRRHPLRRPTTALDRGEAPLDAIVITLHGGPEHGFSATRPWSAPYLRMIPFARAVRTRSKDRIGVVRVRHTHTGWNGGEQTTLGEVRWLLAELTETHPGLPIGLLGHSLGGRTALAAAGHPQVRSVVALAPWVTDHDDVDQLRGREVLLLQGDRDRECPPRATRAYAERVKAAGIDVELRIITGAGHAMVRQAQRWHDLAAGHLVRTLLPPAQDAKSTESQ